MLSEKSVKQALCTRILQQTTKWETMATLYGPSLLLAFSIEAEDSVWYHTSLPSEIIVLGHQRLTSVMPHAAKKHPVSFDPTFNFGPYEVTPMTYRSPIFERKSKNVPGKWTPAVMLGPTILHDDKSESTFRYVIVFLC